MLSFSNVDHIGYCTRILCEAVNSIYLLFFLFSFFQKHLWMEVYQHTEQMAECKFLLLCNPDFSL